MKLVPALELEANRESQAFNEIYIHKDGKFYHIYEWSAWLVKTFVCTEDFQRERGDAKMLVVSRCRAKGNEYVIIGFPVESLSKYIPDYEDVRQLEGDDLVITIKLDNIDYEETKAVFEEWKAMCPMKENKNKGRNDIVHGDGTAPMLARSGLFQIASKILSYPLESSTPTQNIEFLSKLRQEVAALL